LCDARLLTGCCSQAPKSSPVATSTRREEPLPESPNEAGDVGVRNRRWISDAAAPPPHAVGGTPHLHPSNVGPLGTGGGDTRGWKQPQPGATEVSTRAQAQPTGPPARAIGLSGWPGVPVRTDPAQSGHSLHLPPLGDPAPAPVQQPAFAPGQVAFGGVQSATPFSVPSLSGHRLPSGGLSMPVLSFADSGSWAGQSPVGTGTATISWAPAPSPAPTPASAITQTTAPMGYPGGTGGAATGVRALGQEGFLALTTLQAQGRTKGRGERVREVVEESQDPDDALPPSQHVRTGDE